MIIKILGEQDTKAYQIACQTVRNLHHKIDNGKYYAADLAIAPLLTQKLSIEEFNSSKYGTLIFHPSPLPYGRGKSAIKFAYKRNEPITAATWFWANEKFDAGDICEMEIIKIDYAISPRTFYENDILPALARTLQRALIDINKGITRRIPQIEKYSTYD